MSADKKGYLSSSGKFCLGQIPFRVGWPHHVWTIEPVHNYSFRLIGTEWVNGDICRVNVFSNGDAVIKKERHFLHPIVMPNADEGWIPVTSSKNVTFGDKAFVWNLEMSDATRLWISTPGQDRRYLRKEGGQITLETMSGNQEDFKWSLEPVDTSLTVGTALGLLPKSVQNLMGARPPMSPEWPRINPNQPQLHFNEEGMHRPFANWQAWPTEK
jgi:hypothetical protein